MFRTKLEAAPGRKSESRQGKREGAERTLTKQEGRQAVC